MSYHLEGGGVTFFIFIEIRARRCCKYASSFGCRGCRHWVMVLVLTVGPEGGHWCAMCLINLLKTNIYVDHLGPYGFEVF
jgi:hypothetical protein